MKNLINFNKFSAYAILCFWIISCNNSTDKAVDYCSLVTNLDKEVQALITDKSCTSSADCSYIAYGTKACGGPDSYLIYSNKKTDTGELNTKVNEYNSALNACRQSGGLSSSDCSVPSVPTPSCVIGLCTN
jgi:hypothetical protein